MGMAPISTTRPPADDRFQQLTEGSVMVMAIRVSPAADSPVVYAGLEEPAILHEHHLEYFIAAGVLILLALAAWMTWCVVGRTLRPVAAIRARMSEITVSDLSLRVPIPPGEDEIALLARTANQTLTRLEEAVEQQRRFRLHRLPRAQDPDRRPACAAGGGPALPRRHRSARHHPGGADGERPA
ncbi:hypothetical protein GCM10018952_40190 [Streptosporangium vulgare]